MSNCQPGSLILLLEVWYMQFLEYYSTLCFCKQYFVHVLGCSYFIVAKMVHIFTLWVCMYWMDGFPLLRSCCTFRWVNRFSLSCIILCAGTHCEMLNIGSVWRGILIYMKEITTTQEMKIWFSKVRRHIWKTKERTETSGKKACQHLMKLKNWYVTNQILEKWHLKLENTLWNYVLVYLLSKRYFNDI